MNKKAFTLAEVLITLSILGVVAALTIPALVNRNSDIAAQTKLKKAIAAYETSVAAYMAETGAANASAMLGTNCNDAEKFFKIVERAADSCEFTTADGADYVFNASGNAVVYDAKTSPRYGVKLWAGNGQVNGLGKTNTINNVIKTDIDALDTGAKTLNPSTRKLSAAPEFLKGNFACSAAATISADGATAISCTKVD